MSGGTGADPLPGVGVTSLGVAMVRAHESERPDRLFDDPLAAAFVAAAPDAFPEARQRQTGEQKSVGAAFGVHTIIRTRFYDDYLLAACATGIRQVVLLAAGLDARAFRLAWPDGTHVFEVDLPEVLAFKESVLTARQASPRCARTVVPVDLRDDWPAALRAAGFDTTRPTAWLIEGLLIYLSHDEADRLLTAVDTLSAATSQVSFEHATPATADLLNRARTTPSMAKYASLWRGGLSVDSADWLRAHRWTPTRHNLTDLAERYGRPTKTTAASGFLTAVRTPR
jgi:methyltransferase (TIGR00027 family)